MVASAARALLRGQVHQSNEVNHLITSLDHRTFSNLQNVLRKNQIKIAPRDPSSREIYLWHRVSNLPRQAAWHQCNHSSSWLSVPGPKSWISSRTTIISTRILSRMKLLRKLNPLISSQNTSILNKSVLSRSSIHLKKLNHQKSSITSNKGGSQFHSSDHSQQTVVAMFHHCSLGAG